MRAKLPEGYTAEELDRDNPYNQWMYEDQDKQDDEADEFAEVPNVS